MTVEAEIRDPLIMNGPLRVAVRRSINSRVVVAMATVGLFTFLVAISGALRDLVVAGRFGTSAELDAFLIAFLLPTFAISVIAGALATAFLPTYVQVRERDGPEAAQHLLAGALAVATGVLGAASVLLGIVGYAVLPRMGSAFSAHQVALSRGLFLVLLPALVIKGVATIWGAVLNAGERFALVAVAPALVPISVVAVLFTVGRHLGIYALAVGVVLGYVCEASVLAAALRRQGMTVRFAWHGMTPALREVMRQYAPMVAGSVLMSSTLLVDQTMAAALAPGSVALLHFGNKVVALVLTVASAALGSALFPHYSRMVARRDWQGIRATVRAYGGMILLLSVFVVALMIVFREPIIRLLFQRGAFSATDTMRVAQVHMFYALQIPFYLLATVLVRLISSLNANEILMWGAAINLPLDVALNFALIPKLGVAGIALSTSLMYAMSCCFSAVMLARRVRRLAG